MGTLASTPGIAKPQQFDIPVFSSLQNDDFLILLSKAEKPLTYSIK